MMGVNTIPFYLYMDIDTGALPSSFFFSSSFLFFFFFFAFFPFLFRGVLINKINGSDRLFQNHTFLDRATLICHENYIYELENII